MDDLITEFLTETSENLGELDVGLVKLEQNPNDKELLSQIFRVIHTVKGTCGFLGLPRLEAVAHKGEDVLGLFRDGTLEVTPEYVTLIFESLDRIKLILDGLESTGSEPEGDDTELIQKLADVLKNAGVTPSDEVIMPDMADIIIEPKTQEETPEEQPVAAEPPPAAAPTPAAEDADQAVPKESSVANQSLRVNVDVLENLMTLVSELVLNRNQLLQILRSQVDSEFTAPLQRLNHVVSDLQEGVM